MVEFAGYAMPLHYQGGINQEHLAVRQDVGLFDVSHMGEIRVIGDGATEFLRYATLNDPGRLKHGRGQYNMLPNDQGGLIDDLYVYREQDEEYLVVANAANVAAVFDHLRHLAEGRDVHVIDETDAWALLALQGPGAPLLLGRLVDEDIGELRRNATMDVQLSGCPARVSRTGYTGEDGFEVMILAKSAPMFWRALVEAGGRPIGLGARDTLRLEAGMNLYGQDMDETTNPLESGLAWTVDMKTERDFVGRRALEAGELTKQMVGLVLLDRGVLRGHQKVHTRHGEGEITSGTFSPTMQQSIALARIPMGIAPGEEVDVEIRDKKLRAKVVKYPFVRNGKVLI